MSIWVTDISGEFFHVFGSEVRLLVRFARAVVAVSVMVRELPETKQRRRGGGGRKKDLHLLSVLHLSR